MEEGQPYRINIDKKWMLDDLYIFPRTFEQVYFALYALEERLEGQDLERIERAFEAFPWQGGYSAVNFYNQLKYILPRKRRPALVAIKYQSPGWIELTAVLLVVLSVARVVKSVAAALKECNSAYSEIFRELQKRKLLRIKIRREEIKLQKDDLDFIIYCSKEMSKILGIKNLKKIHSMTGHPYRTLKILLSLYRRVRTLAEYQSKGKVDFSEEGE